MLLVFVTFTFVWLCLTMFCNFLLHYAPELLWLHLGSEISKNEKTFGIIHGAAWLSVTFRGFSYHPSEGNLFFGMLQTKSLRDFPWRRFLTNSVTLPRRARGHTCVRQGLQCGGARARELQVCRQLKTVQSQIIADMQTIATENKLCNNMATSSCS